ncbi:hypothetical protein GOV09_00475 [Candidatus Woesearchaeota archaeon]|nr:hypothetical protein [Candidatus Woesearchaeota archaeon]
MRNPSRIVFADEKLKSSFSKLKKGTHSERQLFKHITHAFEALEEDAFVGIHLPKRLIPQIYKKKYDIKNIWKYNLPNGWRLLYAVEAVDIIVISIILEWLDHKKYERRFNY